MNDRIYVWDRFVRLFHWTLAVAFVVAYATGEEETWVHTYAGYLILGLLASRIIWGLVGSSHARFADFLYSPRVMFDYLRGLVTAGNVKRYLGHSPAGGWMVFALLISLSLTVFSGLKIEAAEGRGLLAETAPVSMPTSDFVISSAHADEDKHESGQGEHDNGDEEVWEEIHEFFANFSIILVVLHVGGVMLASVRHRENLVKAMLTGYKRP